MTLAKQFAGFVVDTQFRDLDTSVVEHIKKLTLKEV
jgi:hypothetical protein